MNLTATARLSNGTTQNVTSQAQWNSTNPAVATVSSSGLVTPVAVGGVDVTAVYQGQMGGVTINVPAPWSVSGLGDNVVTIPSYVRRVRIDASYDGRCQNFMVDRPYVNIIIGTCSVADTRSPWSGTYAVSGGTSSIHDSTGVRWTFTELR